MSGPYIPGKQPRGPEWPKEPIPKNPANEAAPVSSNAEEGIGARENAESPNLRPTEAPNQQGSAPDIQRIADAKTAPVAVSENPNIEAPKVSPNQFVFNPDETVTDTSAASRAVDELNNFIKNAR